MSSFYDLIATVSYDKILQNTATVFFVLDILGALPIIVSYQKRGGHFSPKKTTLVAGALMLVFLAFGGGLLEMLKLKPESFKAVGGLILFILGLELVLGIQIFQLAQGQQDLSVVPIAFPLITGPGIYTHLLVLRKQHALINIVPALLINIVVMYLVLRYMHLVLRLIGTTGMLFLQKFIGLVLMAMAIDLLKACLCP